MNDRKLERWPRLILAITTRSLVTRKAMHRISNIIQLTYRDIQLPTLAGTCPQQIMDRTTIEHHISGDAPMNS